MRGLSGWFHLRTPISKKALDRERSEREDDLAPDRDSSSIDSTDHGSLPTCLFTVVGHIDSSDALESMSVWASFTSLDFQEGTNLVCLCEDTSWAAILSRLNEDMPLITNHPNRSKLVAQMEKYSLLGPDKIPPGWVECKDGVCSGEVDLWTRHQSDHLKAIANAETDVESTEDADAESTVNSSAVRMFAYVTSEKGHRTADSHLARIITTTENCGSFAALQVGGLLQSWYHDPGSLLTQMTSNEIAKCTLPFQRVSREQVHFVFAEHALSKSVNLYRASGV